MELSIIHPTHFTPTISLEVLAVSLFPSCSCHLHFLRTRALPLQRLLSYTQAKYRDDIGEFELLVSNTFGLLYLPVNDTRMRVRNR